MATPSLTSSRPNDRLAQLWEDLRAEAVPPKPVVTQRNMVASVPLIQNQPIHHRWKVDLSTLFHSLLEPEALEPSLPSAGEEFSEAELFLEQSVDAAHEASLAVSSPFHWEPKPAWINQPGHFTPAFLNPTDPRRFAPKPKIPLRPLHKQPFYIRLFFYLSHWLRRQR